MSNTKLTLSELKYLIIAMLILSSGVMGLDINLPSLPFIMKYLHTDQANMQLSVSLYLLGTFMSILVYGPLSDKYGRKPVMIFGLSLSCITSFLTMSSHSIESFLLFRFVQGLGAGVCFTLARTIITDLMQGEKLANMASYFSMLVSISPLLAPAVGGYIQELFYWQVNFFVLGIIIAILLVAFILFCKETNLNKNPQAFSLNGIVKNYTYVIKQPIFLGGAIIAGLGSAINIVFATLGAFIIQIELNYSPVVYGWAITSIALVIMLSKIICPYVTQKLGSQKTILFGLILIFIAGAALLLGKLLHLIDLGSLMLCVYIAIFGLPFVMLNAMALALSSFAGRRGAANSVYSSGQHASGFIFSASVSLFSTSGIVPLALTYITISSLSLICYFTIIDKLTSKDYRFV
ncbi:MAG: multidrug effflux MFS transporter [Pseudomonadota bacterium]